MIEVDYKQFQKLLNEYYPDRPVTEGEAAEAFHNLVGFVTLLMQIKQETQLGSPHSRNN
jgi:hypothetical protein